MKQLKASITCLLLTLFVSLIASCKGQKNPNTEAQKKQITEITKVIKSVEDPKCETSDEFVNNVLTNRESQRCTAILNRLTINEITEMCKVIIHREGYVDKKLFLKEYDESYQRVYKYLEEKEPPIKNDTILDVQNNNVNIKVTKHGTTSISDPIRGKQTE